MSSSQSDGYRRLRDCAAYRCERTRNDGHLERISPKGKGNPFVGLCPDHYGRAVVLNPVAATLMEIAGVGVASTRRFRP